MSHDVPWNTAAMPDKLAHHLPNRDVSKIKLEISSSLLLLSVGVLGLRFEESILSVPALLGCFGLLALEKRSAVLPTILLVSLVFVAPHNGWLYGFDSNLEAVRVTELLEGAKNIGTLTPLLHLHAAIVSRLVGLAAFPTVEGRLLSTWLLPIGYTVATISLISLVIRRNQRQFALGLLPVLLWVPLSRFHTGFRRQSIGLVFFALLIYAVYRYMNSLDRRFVPLCLLAALFSPLAHHFTALIVVLFIFCAAAVAKIKNTLLISAGIIFAWWFLVLPEDPSMFYTILHFLSSDGNQPAALPFNTVSLSLVTIVERIVAEWGFQLLISGPILIDVATRYRAGRSIDDLERVTVVFGGAIGILSAVAFVSSLAISASRVMTFFVLVGAPIAVASIYRLSNRVSRPATPLIVAFIVALTTLSAVMLPAHVLFDTPPDYSQNVVDQRFSRTLYATGEFVDGAVPPDLELIGDHHVNSVVGRMTGERVWGRHQAILSGNVPANSVVILTQRNRQLYLAWNLEFGENWVGIIPHRPINKFETKNEKVYSNGRSMLFLEV
jgi:hypothetical protein